MFLLYDSNCGLTHRYGDAQTGTQVTNCNDLLLPARCYQWIIYRLTHTSPNIPITEESDYVSTGNALGGHQDSSFPSLHSRNRSPNKQRNTTDQGPRSQVSFTFLQLASQQAKGDPGTKLAHQHPLSTRIYGNIPFRSIVDPRLDFTTKVIYIEPLHNHLSHHGDYNNYIHQALNNIYIHNTRI